MNTLKIIIIFTLIVTVVYSSSESSSDRDSSDKETRRERILDKDGFREHCEGDGKKYCKKPWRESCPSVCKKECKGKYSSDNSESESEYKKLRSDIRSAIKRRYFDQAFIDNDKICVANCKGGRKYQKCHKWESYKGKKYCLALDCRKGIDGCHQRKDFERPSCKACRRIFPKCK
ncbi:hypothetical protein TetV_591 [Tetraselmis virus 1]|uniref:Uncharacterized protein n=1 Tax=Tetraselmis virus 1 TaxID=2060617 RepID=A0A2P0VP42_9VIRU|nr:hypothetical protein QJ968_gp463 [Tetraselmis virus 1]AUF82673.1 hypothetical protein TetV_591 [Tetraselmis virus 1]